jgi:hypothetical protein
MSDKKFTSRSHEEVGPYRDSPDAVDREGIGNNDPLEPDKDAALLFQVMSRLQSVRVPSKGRLTADEAIETALEQGNAFRRWKESGSLVGEIEVWVEGRRVMSVLPESPAELQEFTFRVPSPDAAVLQLTTQANGEQVVLYTLPLRNVPEKGLDHTEWWSNGQHIRLSITCNLCAIAASTTQGGFSGSEKVESFCIRVAVNPLSETARPGAGEEPLRRRVATAGGASEDSSTSKLDSGKLRGMGAKSFWQRLILPVRLPVVGVARAVTVLILVLSLMMAVVSISKLNNVESTPAPEPLVSSTTPKVTFSLDQDSSEAKPAEPNGDSHSADTTCPSGNFTKSSIKTVVSPPSGSQNASNEEVTIGVRVSNKEKQELTSKVNCGAVADDVKRTINSKFTSVQAVYVGLERQHGPSKNALGIAGNCHARTTDDVGTQRRQLSAAIRP